MDEKSIQQWENGCLSKKRIQTEDIAKIISDKSGLDYYRCPDCSFWHMTKKKAIGVRFRKLRIVR